MRIFTGLDAYKPIQHPVLSIGTFDGVHVGHATILQQLNSEAQRLVGESILMTFWPHPRMVVQPGNTSLKLLNTLEEKCTLLERSGLQNLLIMPFDYEFSRTSSEDFVTKMLVERIGVKKVIIGYDHHFGRNREGSLDILRDYAPIFGFEVEETPPQQIDAINVSSTKIRKALLEGDVSQANEYLGYHYFMIAHVVSGYQRGSKLGFPTANLQVESANKLIPKDGVYAVHLKVDDTRHKGMMNIGNRPTFPGSGHSLEVHLFDFEGDIYNKKVEVEFVDRIRDEQKFDSLDALKMQLDQDRDAAKALLSE